MSKPGEFSLQSGSLKRSCIFAQEPNKNEQV